MKIQKYHCNILTVTIITLLLKQKTPLAASWEHNNTTDTVMKTIIPLTCDKNSTDIFMKAKNTKNFKRINWHNQDSTKNPLAASWKHNNTTDTVMKTITPLTCDKNTADILMKAKK